MHPNGTYEAGLDVARYINAFPGTPGDFRAWIGGIRPVEDITALLDNIKYAYTRAKLVIIEEELAKLGVTFSAAVATTTRQRQDDPSRAYKVLVCDFVGLNCSQGACRSPRGKIPRRCARRRQEAGERYNPLLLSAASFQSGRHSSVDGQRPV